MFLRRFPKDTCSCHQIVTVKGVIISHRLLSLVFNRTMYFLRCLGFAWTHPICAIFSMNNLNLFGCLHTSVSE